MENVLYDGTAGSATITLNRPDRMNALTQDLMEDLRRALEKAASDTKVRAVCLTGSGRGFCAGQDLSERDPRKHQHPFDLQRIQQELYHPVISLITEMDKPVVASVNGIAAGAGVGLALASDIVIAAEPAKFILSFSKVGLSVDAGGGWFLTQSLGPARARAALMLAEAITAEEAASAGMIYKSVPEAELRQETDALLTKLQATPRTSLAMIKKSVCAAMSSANLADYLCAESANQGVAGRDPDYPEGVLSFLEKRPAKFR